MACISKPPPPTIPKNEVLTYGYMAGVARSQNDGASSFFDIMNRGIFMQYTLNNNFIRRFFLYQA